MAYVIPTEFVTKMIDAGEAKVFMTTRDTLIRAFMAGAILTLGAAFAVTITVQTGLPLAGAILFPVGFCLLYLMGYDLLTVTAKAAPSVRMAPAMKARISVSRVDMKTLASPASIILVTNSVGMT